MARPQELQEPIRVNYVIEKRQDRALRELAHNTNRNLSELIRMAIDNFLETESCDVDKPIRGELLDVLKLLEHLTLNTKRNETMTEWELKRSDLGLMFGPQWWRMKAVVEMTVSAMNLKGYDTLHEEVVRQVEVPGTNRTRHEKMGFRLCVFSGMTKAGLKELYDLIESDARRFGFLKPLKETEGEMERGADVK